ncbi:MAG TPA: adenosylmethionine--8-amino-7-oxononanoate transaminase, partial [Candidatus Sulfotelmatobacter sp.]|nr:adenosylmethionine--8-amino-7-oxononanoate transaminase [Candidatus Sulfotelmatobacter sp.]
RDCVLETLRLARAPVAAALAEQRRIDVDSLLLSIRTRAALGDDPSEQRADAKGSDAPRRRLLIVEGIGGVMVPLDEVHCVRDLMRRLDAPVVIAARAGLGTINHCVLTVEACRNAGIEVAGIVLSDVDGTTDDAFANENAWLISRLCDAEILGILPHLSAEAHEANAGGWDVEALAHAALRRLALSNLEAFLLTRDNKNDAVVSADRTHVWHPFTQTSEWAEEEPLVISKGEGCWLVAANGRRYLDGVASLWANIHGHAHPVLDRALHEQTGRIAHTTFLGLTHEPGALLAEELTDVLPQNLTRVFYSDSGSAAVEVALRIALLAQRHRGEQGRSAFVSLEDAYHGDTAGSVSIGRSDPFHRGLDPLLFEAIRIPSPFVAGEETSLAALRDVFAQQGKRVAALVLEPRMQAAAGMWPHSDAWLREAMATAHKHDALVIVDEVATGFGRTGDLFACTGADVRPDVLALGKGLTGGYLPLSATVTTEEIFELFTAPFEDHRTLYYGHTYSGNPLACAVARVSLALFDEEETLERGRRLSQRLAVRLAALAALPTVKEVRQRGVMVGIELADEKGAPLPASRRTGRAVTLASRRRGVIVRPLGDVIVLNPPLVMDDAEVDVLVATVAEAIQEVAAASTDARV